MLPQKKKINLLHLANDSSRRPKKKKHFFGKDIEEREDFFKRFAVAGA
jgi:hypothetical protein